MNPVRITCECKECMLNLKGLAKSTEVLVKVVCGSKIVIISLLKQNLNLEFINRVPPIKSKPTLNAF